MSNVVNLMDALKRSIEAGEAKAKPAKAGKRAVAEAAPATAGARNGSLSVTARTPSNVVIANLASRRRQRCWDLEWILADALCHLISRGATPVLLTGNEVVVSVELVLVTRCEMVGSFGAASHFPARRLARAIGCDDDSLGDDFSDYPRLLNLIPSAGGNHQEYQEQRSSTHGIAPQHPRPHSQCWKSHGLGRGRAAKAPREVCATFMSRKGKGTDLIVDVLYARRHRDEVNKDLATCGPRSI